jgi:hypothetical protein
MGMKRKFDGNVALITGIADGVRRLMELLKNRDGGEKRKTYKGEDEDMM